MAIGLGIIQSTRMNHSMLRSRGMQRVKYRSKMTGLGTKAATHVSPMTSYHDEKRMRRAVARGIRREIISYLLVIVLLSIAGLMIYGVFFA